MHLNSYSINDYGYWYDKTYIHPIPSAYYIKQEILRMLADTNFIII